MTESFIAEFRDGSMSVIDSVRYMGGRREFCGIATRGDGIRRVVFFADPGNDGFLIPRDHDDWLHNIRCRGRFTAAQLIVEGRPWPVVVQNQEWLGP